MVTKHLYTYIALALVILLAACEKHLKEEGREIEINGSEHLSE